MKVSKSCPCNKDCEERNVTCHSTCKKYKKWKFLQQIEINQYKEEQAIDRAVSELTVNGALNGVRPKSLKRERNNNGHK